jgi:hypothetical protein
MWMERTTRNQMIKKNNGQIDNIEWIQNTTFPLYLCSNEHRVTIENYQQPAAQYNIDLSHPTARGQPAFIK